MKNQDQNNNGVPTSGKRSAKGNIFLASKKYKSIASDLVHFLIRYHQYIEYDFFLCMVGNSLCDFDVIKALP